MALIDNPISAVSDVVNTVITRLFPDKTQQALARAELDKMKQSGELKVVVSAAGIIQAEAKSEHWLTATWRPIVMLSFTALVVAYWLGITAPNLPSEQVLALLGIIKIGLGGYVIGRSAEKTVKAWKSKT